MLKHIWIMRKYLLVALGGGIGSIARFLCGVLLSNVHLWPPTAILLINVSGSFLIGFLHFLSDPAGRIYLGPGSRLFLLVGFCGGYTTFSSFSLACFGAIRLADWNSVVLNIGLSNSLCLLGAWLGYLASRGSAKAMGGLSVLLRQERN
jgi:fluoride exporter